MQSKRTRLDRFISVTTGIHRGKVRLLIAQKRLYIDHQLATDIHQFVDEFTHVRFDEQLLQAKTPVYIIMNKPVGVVSATKDEKHITVIDIFKKSLHKVDHAHILIDELHIVGRLDFNTSGLLLLTNDGRWSRQLTQPEAKVPKLYHVTLANPIDTDYIQAFADGMYFPFENITTRPATLSIINDHEAMVTLVEGRYHQIKRMFGRFQNPVIKLHRVAIGDFSLDETITAGEWKELAQCEQVKNPV